MAGERGTMSVHWPIDLELASLKFEENRHRSHMLWRNRDGTLTPENSVNNFLLKGRASICFLPKDAIILQTILNLRDIS